MKTLVDTGAWSLLFRRARIQDDDAVTQALRELLAAGDAAIIGPVRQELLSGIRATPAFEYLRLRLRAIDDEPLATEDFETAAEFFNRCRVRGIQGANTDYLICAVAARNGLEILTTAGDFRSFATVLPIRLSPASS